jgi:hypothetical protein
VNVHGGAVLTLDVVSVPAAKGSDEGEGSVCAAARSNPRFVQGRGGGGLRDVALRDTYHQR